MAKILCFDIDGIINVLEPETKHEDLAGTYIYRPPNLETRELMQRAMRLGWTIILWTGRRENQRRLTENYLDEHHFPYHYLFMGKPYCTWFVDDRQKTLQEIRELIDGEEGVVLRPVEKKAVEVDTLSFMSGSLLDELAVAVSQVSIKVFENLGINTKGWWDHLRQISDDDERVSVCLTHFMHWIKEELQQRIRVKRDGGDQTKQAPEGEFS